MKFSDYKQRAVAFNDEQRTLRMERKYCIGVNRSGDEVMVAISANPSCVEINDVDAVSLHVYSSAGFPDLQRMSVQQFERLARIREAIDRWVRGERDDLPADGWCGDWK